MKDLNIIIKLLDAGYTKEDIDALVLPKAEVKDAEAEVKDAEAEVKETETGVKENVKTVDNTEVLGRLDKLEKLLQKNAIMSDSVNPKKDTTQDILASIINPYLEKE